MNEKQAKIYAAFLDWKRARCWFSSNHITETTILLDDFNNYMDQSGLNVSVGIPTFERLLMSSYFKKLKAGSDTYWNGISIKS